MVARSRRNMNEACTSSNDAREAAAAKAAETARRKAEREAQEAEEMSSLKSAKPSKSGNSKGAPKKAKGLDLSQLDSPEGTTGGKGSALNATGIDNALDALSLTSGHKETVDRHPERRFKAAYAGFEERRLEEMKADKTLRRQQKVDQIRKEFEKSPENPFNQVSASYNSTREDIAAIKDAEQSAKERRLAGSS